MPRIWYQEAGATGRRSVAATSLTQALLDLRDKQAKVAAAGEEGAPGPLGEGTRPWNSLTPIYEQLAALLQRGTPLTEALTLLAGRCRELPLRYSLGRLAREVREGRPLHEAMALQPRVYSSLVVGAVAAGEAADDLGATFADLARQQQKLSQATLRLLPLVIYPLLIAALISVDLLFLGTFIMPKFLQLYRELGVTNDHMPILTRLMVPMVRVLPPFFAVLVGLLATVFALSRVRATLLLGRFDVRLLCLRLPLLGQLAQEVALARAASALGLLLARRVPLSRALRLAGRASDDPFVDLGLRQAAVPVAEGASLGEALRVSPGLPQGFVQELAAADAADNLPAAMQRVSDSYWQHVLYQARTQPYIIAPLVIVFLGILVALVAFGLFSPLVAIIGELSG